MPWLVVLPWTCPPFLTPHTHPTPLAWPAVVCACLQAFINTAREIYKKIQDGVFDVSNEARGRFQCLHMCGCTTNACGQHLHAPGEEGVSVAAWLLLAPNHTT